jgi:hypothetical protein
VGSYTTTLSNSSFNEARLLYGSNKALIVGNKSGTGGSAQLAKAPVGSFAHIEYPGAMFGCPTFTGLEGEENIVLADNLTMSSGRHQLKIGAQANQVRTIIDATNYLDGFWSHPTDGLFDRADPATYPDAFISNVGPALAKTNLWNSYYYIQDTWQAIDGLTLNLGLRYDVDRSVTAGNELVDAKNARTIQRYGGAPLLQKTKVDYDNFAPRIGLSGRPSVPDARRFVGVAAFFTIRTTTTSTPSTSSTRCCLTDSRSSTRTIRSQIRISAQQTPPAVRPLCARFSLETIRSFPICLSPRRLPRWWTAWIPTSRCRSRHSSVGGSATMSAAD